MKAVDLTGRKFGLLTAIVPTDLRSGSNIKWFCLCECGGQKIISVKNLKKRVLANCGCIAEAKKQDFKYKPNKRKVNRVYRIWIGMRARCRDSKNKSYKNYGGKGIDVCDEWSSFDNFEKWALENGYDDSLTIDRLDNSIGYRPDNCRWATRLQLLVSSVHVLSGSLPISISSIRERLVIGSTAAIVE